MALLVPHLISSPRGQIVDVFQSKIAADNYGRHFRFLSNVHRWLSAASRKYGIVLGRCPKAFPLPLPRLAGGYRSAASEGGSVRGSPCGDPARLRLTSLRPPPSACCAGNRGP
jgi:hypothetical protein